MPFEEFVEKIDQKDGRDEEKLLADYSKIVSENLGIKFDYVVGSTRNISNGRNDFVKIVEIGDLTEEHLRGKMFKNTDDKAVAFVHAYSRKIIFIDVPDGKDVDLNILFANTDTPLVSQVLIKTGRESTLNLFEWFGSKAGSASLSAVMHEIKIGSYGKAEINLVHNEDANTQVLGFSKGSVADNGHLKINYVYNGGVNSRIKNEIRTEGYGAKSNVIEIVMGSGDQKFDLSTRITNVGKDTISDLESKAVLTDKTVCLLKGFAKIEDTASGSRSFVNERGILLDKRAYISSIPGMSIDNSNVKATHSSATAPVDEELLFYLMARGIDAKSAQKLLVSGFFSNSIAKIGSALVKSAIVSLMNEKINTKRFGDIPKIDISSIWFDPKAIAAQGMFEGHHKYRDG